MRKLAAAAVAAFLLSGCATNLAQKDDTECAGYGLQPGTQAYADCRLRIKERRAHVASAILNSGPTQVNCQHVGNSTTRQAY